jgi:hypothetical protein
MEGVLNREKAERARKQSAARKAWWARRKAAAVETGVCEEPRSEPATNPYWVRREGTHTEREQSFKEIRKLLKQCTPSGEACGRCGHGLGVHDYRGCQAGACRCGSYR